MSLWPVICTLTNGLTCLALALITCLTRLSCVIFLVPTVRVELTRLAAMGFESIVSAIPPRGQLGRSPASSQMRDKMSEANFFNCAFEYP